MLIMGMKMLTNLFKAGNYGSEAVAERAYVLKEKSIDAAALSALDGRQTLAVKFDELEKNGSGITAKAYDKADKFRAEYRAQRALEGRPQV